MDTSREIQRKIRICLIHISMYPRNWVHINWVWTANNFWIRRKKHSSFKYFTSLFKFKAQADNWHCLVTFSTPHVRVWLRERGNKPYDLELMLRIYILQNLYDLSDMRVMTEVIDSRAFSEFCGVDSSNQVPDGDTIGRFRNILVATPHNSSKWLLKISQKKKRSDFPLRLAAMML